jgi:DNA polymerase alpha-associated DNA helicase A
MCLHPDSTGAIQVCWIPIFKAKKLILAGDPMQLPPTILSIGKHNKKQKSKPVSTTISLSQQNDTADKLPATSIGTSMDSLTLSGSESENSSDGDQMLVRDGAALETPPVLTTRPGIKAAGRKPKLIGLRPPRTLEITLFDRLEKMYGAGIKRMLKVQYRLVISTITLKYIDI